MGPALFLAKVSLRWPREAVSLKLEIGSTKPTSQTQRMRLGPPWTLDTPGTLGPPPTYLRTHLPEGPKGEGGGRAAVQPSAPCSLPGSRLAL
jgi:hypothetical protein